MQYEIAPSSAIEKIVEQYPQTKSLFEELNIDYRSSEEKKLNEACREKNISVGDVIERLNVQIERGK